MLFYSSMSWYNSLCYCIFSLCCCILLFYCTVHWYLIFLCSSSSYVCVFDCIYCRLTLPPGVNPIAVNKYPSIYLSKVLRIFCTNMKVSNTTTRRQNPVVLIPRTICPIACHLYTYLPNLQGCNAGHDEAITGLIQDVSSTMNYQRFSAAGSNLWCL